MEGAWGHFSPYLVNSRPFTVLHSPPLSVIEQIAEILHVEPHCFLEPREGVETFDKMGFVDEASALIAERSREILMGLLE